MGTLRIATVGLDLMAEALRAQDADVTAVDWRPPGGGDPEVVRALTATYGDPRVGEANARALARLQEARPMIVGAGPAGELIPGLEGRMVLHAGPPVEWERMCAPQRNAVTGACILEGWASGPQEAADLVARGGVRLAPAHSLEAAGAMCGVISPSMACWAARDEIGGGVGYSPFNDGPGDAFWLGVGSPEAIRRQRLMADEVAPGFAAALRAEGPIDALALCAQGIAMGDDCHMRHQATTMLLLRQVLPAMAEHAPAAVLPTARLLGGNGHFALTVTIAAARAALAGIRGIPASSLVVFISRNGTDAAVQIAGLPDRWFTFPAPLVGDPLYRPGFSDDDAAPDIGDSALVECAGLGGAASAASPGVAAFLGGGLQDAIERTRRMGDICIGRSERLRIPTLDGEGTPLGVDARACVDLGETPLINTGILHREDGGQIGAGIAVTPVEPIRDALRALAAHLEDGPR
ncbi:DUF1116 domain-containing protein [Miltoncostaea oceani]|jgi:hypothetical protein|uniref:DUF1116 domain-containing protein n=1 Tax=Miltoncostaea oceani TaxID=2843216 RepID=UPI001C3C93FC|nr:DUF1116 domain-containing protein [Miltoncostaea oceani]